MDESAVSVCVRHNTKCIFTHLCRWKTALWSNRRKSEPLNGWNKITSCKSHLIVIKPFISVNTWVFQCNKGGILCHVNILWSLNVVYVEGTYVRGTTKECNTCKKLSHHDPGATGNSIIVLPPAFVSVGCPLAIGATTTGTVP